MAYSFDSAEVDRMRRIAWAKSGYRPSDGEWEIRGIDNELIIVSRGQREVHECDARLLLVSGGVRAGKTELGAMMAIGHCFVNNGLIWIVGPDYTQADREFSAIVKALAACDWVASISDPKGKSKTVITPWGCEITTKSSKDVRSIAGEAPHFLLGVEMGQQEEDAYTKLRERAIEQGATVLMTGTFEGALSWYPMLWSRWQGPNEEGGRSFSIPTWSNPIFSGYEDKRVQDFMRGITPGIVLERIAAVPYKPQGLVHKTFDPKVHIAKLGYDPMLPIEIAVDPATHTYAIEAIQWERLPIIKHLDKALERGEVIPNLADIPKEKFKEERTRVYVIDEVYEHGVIVHDVIPLVQAKDWYPYVSTGVIDQAGSVRNANRSQVDEWRTITGIGFRWNYLFIEDQPALIDTRLRRDPDMHLPTILFDWHMRNERTFQGRALGLLAEFGLYQYPKWRQGSAMPRAPINANNDGVKALCYWLYDKFRSSVERQRAERRGRVRRYGLR